jgi:hypothetical protein
MNAETILTLVLDFLEEDPSGKDAYTWHANGPEAVETVLGAAFASGDPSPLIDGLLRLASALEQELRSPGAAALILAIVAADPRVFDLFARREATKDETSRWSGTDELRRAPMVGAAAPEGTITVASLSDPRASPPRHGPRPSRDRRRRLELAIAR